MAKLNLTNLSNIGGNPQSAATTINTNNDRIEAALENTLSRDGTSPNQMLSDIDLNNNDLLNVKVLDTDSLILSGNPIVASTDLASGAFLSSAPLATSGTDYLLALKSSAFVRASPYFSNGADYGVLPGNSRAVNSANLQIAVNAVMGSSRGGVLFLGKGVIQLDPTVQITIPKVANKAFTLMGEDCGTVIDIGNSTTVSTFYVGQPTNVVTGGMFCVFRYLKFQGASNAGIAFEFSYANGARFENCTFSLLRNVLKTQSSYGVCWSNCLFENIGSDMVISTTHCHLMQFVDCRIYNVGTVSGTGYVLNVTSASAGTDAIMFSGCEIAGVQGIGRFPDGINGMSILGCYIEFTKGQAFDFGVGAYGLVWEGGWFALSEVAQTFANWKTGRFGNLRMWAHAVSFDSTCDDIDTPGIRLSGGATLSLAGLYKVMSTFLNSATANATYPPRYRKLKDRVYLQGQIDNCPGSGLGVFSLPAGFRPAVRHTLPAVAANDTSARTWIIGTSGTMVPSAPVTEGIKLDGLSFLTI